MQNFTDLEARVVELLRDLVAIPSVNPAYDPSSRGEIAMARYIERWADMNELCTERVPVLGDRANVIVRLLASKDAPNLLFESHMDTVGIVEGTRAGVDPVIDGDVMYGRGTCDTKGSMAAMMAAIEYLAKGRDQLGCNVVFLAAVDEETNGSGALAFAQMQTDISAAIVGEPTECLIVNAHKGVVRGAITVTGRAAHTSVAHEGVNAIDAMADIIVGLRSVSAQLVHDQKGGTLAVSLIEGGSGINVVPERCTIRYDRRTIPGDTRASVLFEIDDVLDQVREARPDVRIDRAEPDLSVGPLGTREDANIVRACASASKALGLDPAVTSVPYGSDASYLANEGGIPCVVFGPGSIAVAHGADEHVPLAELRNAARFFVETAIAFGSSA